MGVSFSIRGHSDFEKDPHFSNVNARQIMDMLSVFCNPNDGLCGEIADKEIDRVAKLAMFHLNVENQNYSTEDHWHSPRCVTLGTSDEHVRYRLRAILELCVKAKRLSQSITFG
ncbi:MAG: hypothetical protein PHI12_08990 [Dehalococcoidales bacterium]|nr:hypothetical protein [Dehalococcoidales bacterium]